MILETPRRENRPGCCDAMKFLRFYGSVANSQGVLSEGDRRAACGQVQQGDTLPTKGCKAMAPEVNARPYPCWTAPSSEVPNRRIRKAETEASERFDPRAAPLRWCDMKVCGNRMKARRFQARRM